jgi:hypothetical protein
MTLITDELDTIAATFSALQPLLDAGEPLTILIDGAVRCGKSPWTALLQDK